MLCSKRFLLRNSAIVDDQTASKIREITVEFWFISNTGENKHTKPLNSDCDCFPINEKLRELTGSEFSFNIEHWNIDTTLCQSSVKPLIVYSHGLDQNRFSGYMNFKNLLHKGYLVAAIDHTNFCSIAYVSEGIQIKMDKREVVQMPIIDIRKYYFEDLKLLLDNIERNGFGGQINDDELRSIIDLDRIGILGHSMGGGTAWQILWSDPRVKAVVSLDGLLSNYMFTKVDNFMEKPILVFRKNPEAAVVVEDIVPTTFRDCQIEVTPHPQFQEVMVQRVLDAGMHVLNVYVPETDHLSFCNRTLMRRQIRAAMKSDAKLKEHRESMLRISESEFLTRLDMVLATGSIDEDRLLLILDSIIGDFFDQHLRLLNHKS